MKIIISAIISALFFNISFFYINDFGYLIIPSLIFLFFVLITIKTSLQAIFFGFLWSSITYGVHFIWFYRLLLDKSNAGNFLSILLYILLVLYLALLTMVWFLFNKSFLFFLNKKIKLIFILFSTYLYFYFIDKYLLIFVEKGFGYPFLNPLIPLAKYKWFVFLFSIFSTPFNENLDVKKFFSENKIIYLEPVLKSYKNSININTAGQIIYHQLANLNLCSYEKEYKRIILVSPETFFPYKLNNHEEIIKLWDNVLPPNASIFLGSYREKKISNLKSKIFQTVYLIEQGLIKNFYDKKHRVPFVEKIPKKYKNLYRFEQLFLLGKEKFSKGRFLKNFEFEENLKIFPQICSEFFYLNSFYQIQKEKSIIFLLTNDSWFLNYFKNIMENLVYLTFLKVRVPILYINHNNLKLIFTQSNN